MRTRIVQAEGWMVTVRGLTRRTPALESEYLVNLKEAHPDTRSAQSDGSSSEARIARDPRAWSLLGTANPFRSLVARCTEIVMPSGDKFQEPFKPDELVAVFNHYLDAEKLPDRSDLWSQVEAAIRGMDNPEPATDPNSGSDTPTT